MLSKKFIKRILSVDIDKFKSFDDNIEFFSPYEKSIYIEYISNMFLEDLKNNTLNPFLFTNFIIQILGPMTKENIYLLFTNNLLRCIASSSTLYNKYLKGFTNLELEEVLLIVDKNLINHLDYSDILCASNKYDEETFSYIVDNILLYPEKIKNVIRMIAIKNTNYFKKTSVDFVSMNENGKFLFDKYFKIMINEKLIFDFINNPTTLKLKKLIFIIFHEIQHSLRYNDYVNNSATTFLGILCSKEYFITDHIDSLYVTNNYKYSVSENDANHYAFLNTCEFFMDYYKEKITNDFLSYENVLYPDFFANKHFNNEYDVSLINARLFSYAKTNNVDFDSQVFIEFTDSRYKKFMEVVDTKTTPDILFNMLVNYFKNRNNVMEMSFLLNVKLTNDQIMILWNDILRNYSDEEIEFLYFACYTKILKREVLNIEDLHFIKEFNDMVMSYIYKDDIMK